MAGFILKRLLQAVFVIFAVTLIVSFAIRLSGDPAVMLVGGAGSVTEQDLQNIRQALGLERPFYVQYLSFLEGLVTGDLGEELPGRYARFHADRAGPAATLLLAFSSLLASIILSVPLGIYAAVNRGRWPDQMIRILSLVGLSFPNFWLAIMMVLLFSIVLGVLPPSGMEGPESFVMPALTMAIILTATNVRLVRTSMLETLSQQYIMVARSKGLRDRVVLYKHALRNSAIPLVTYIGLQFGGLVGGIVIIERVFNWPGMGTLAFDAISNRDYPVLQGTITVLALFIVLINLLVDIAYGLIDPRIRTE